MRLLNPFLIALIVANVASSNRAEAIPCFNFLWAFSGPSPQGFLDLSKSGARYLSQDEFAIAGEVLARSFADGQLNYIFPDLKRQPKYLHWLMPRIIRSSSYSGEVVVNRGPLIKGVALWHRSERLPGFFDELRVGLLKAPFAVTMKSIIKLERLKGYLNKIKKKFCAEGCYFLYFLGTDPPYQGQGVAASLIQPAIEASMRDRVPLYLETQKHANVAFYERFGFEVIHVGKESKEAPNSYVMIRYPD